MRNETSASVTNAIPQAATRYSTRERTWLAVLAVVGLVGLNGVFVWAMLADPDAMWSAFRNPVAAAFIVEAFVLVGVLAWLLAHWQLSRVHWAWFVLLSLVGGIAFAVPAVLLWSERRAAANDMEPR